MDTVGRLYVEVAFLLEAVAGGMAGAGCMAGAGGMAGAGEGRRTVVVVVCLQHIPRVESGRTVGFPSRYIYHTPF